MTKRNVHSPPSNARVENRGFVPSPRRKKKLNIIFYLREICLKLTYWGRREMYRSSDVPTSQYFILRSSFGRGKISDRAELFEQALSHTAPPFARTHAQIVLAGCFGVHYYPLQKHEPQILALQNAQIYKRSLKTTKVMSLFRHCFVCRVVLNAFILGTLY